MQSGRKLARKLKGWQLVSRFTCRGRRGGLKPALIFPGRELLVSAWATRRRSGCRWFQASEFFRFMGGGGRPRLLCGTEGLLSRVCVCGHWLGSGRPFPNWLESGWQFLNCRWVAQVGPFVRRLVWASQVRAVFWEGFFSKSNGALCRPPLSLCFCRLLFHPGDGTAGSFRSAILAEAQLLLKPGLEQGQ